MQHSVRFKKKKKRKAVHEPIKNASGDGGLFTQEQASLVARIASGKHKANESRDNCSYLSSAQVRFRLISNPHTL